MSTTVFCLGWIGAGLFASAVLLYAMYREDGQITVKQIIVALVCAGSGYFGGVIALIICIIWPIAVYLENHGDDVVWPRRRK